MGAGQPILLQGPSPELGPERGERRDFRLQDFHLQDIRLKDLSRPHDDLLGTPVAQRLRSAAGRACDERPASMAVRA